MSKPYNQSPKADQPTINPGSSPDTGSGGVKDDPDCTGNPSNIGSAPGELGSGSVAGKKVGSAPGK